MSIKIPNHAPWAPHGYARMIEQYNIADSLIRNNNLQLTIHSLPQLIANLNTTINAMRPGNLAELEDLHELFPLISRAKQQHSPSKKLQKAIDYAEMTASYVSDGSGTHDMIQKAIYLLNNEINSNQ